MLHCSLSLIFDNPYGIGSVGGDISRTDIRHRSFNLPPFSIPAGGILPCVHRQFIGNSDSGHEQGTLNGRDMTEVRAAPGQKPAKQYEYNSAPRITPRWVPVTSSLPPAFRKAALAKYTLHDSVHACTNFNAWLGKSPERGNYVMGLKSERGHYP